MTYEALTVLQPKPKPKPTTALGKHLARTGITVTDVANACGVNKGTISRIAWGGACSKTLERKILRVTGLKRIY